MSPNPPERSNRDSLQKLLSDAENELRRRLEDACEAEAKGVSTESTAEIRRLEDNLLAAAFAAKQTIAVRSQMRGRTPEVRGRPTEMDVADPETQTEAMGVREFTDDKGQAWRAWSVVPGRSKASSNGQFLGDFQNGWICFEGLDVDARRRLPYPRARWPNISDEDLRRLLQQAIDAPIRENKKRASS